MHIIVLAIALIALGVHEVAAEVGPNEPPGWYLEGPGTRAGPFGSAGLCIDLRNRQFGAHRYQCVEYGKSYWLVVDVPMTGPVAVVATPFPTLQACLHARAHAQTPSGGSFTCTRRLPSSRPLPGTAGMPPIVTRTSAG